MSTYHNVSSALTLLTVLLAAASLLLAAPDPLRTFREVDAPHTDSPAKLPGNRERRYEGGRSIHRDEAEEEEELFKDVDPKKLAAVLLEALNHSQVESRREEEEHEGMDEEMEEPRGDVQKQEANREVSTMARSDRDRDGRQELELLMAARGKEGEREEEEERKKAQEEEERMTEKVTSRTTSQTVQAQPEQQPTSEDGGGENRKDVALQTGSSSPDEGSNEEEEEQLSPEELKSLETMMKEFPRLNPVAKREGDLEANQRESRGYSSYNDIIPIYKGSDLAMSKKKLKWQEETQKALHFPTFKGGNFMDDFDDKNDVQPSPPPQRADCEGEADCVGEVEPEEEEEEEEEMLSPEEEEVRAKAEQEEMRRQAAEAQRAKMEEEKLADIASDMLLRYMVKQNNSNKKYSSSLSNAMEDKRSDEEQEVTEEDDIDPQTIDKLIEISSKLHLPADDVVDIISDVEKKKKKDVPPDVTSYWQQPQSPLPSSFSSVPQTSANQNSLPVSKQPFPAIKLLKSWFQEKMPAKSKDLWSKSDKPLSASKDVWSKPQKPFSVRKDFRPKSPKASWNSYPFHPYTYPSFYQRRPYPYYPIYFPPPPRAEAHYYLPRPALSAQNFLGKSVEDTFPFPPQRRYQSWVQPRLRKPPTGLQQKSFYTTYPLPLYPRTFQPLPKTRSPPGIPVVPPQHRQVYYPAPPPAVSRNKDYYMTRKQVGSSSSSHDDLEKYIQQILMKRPQIMD